MLFERFVELMQNAPVAICNELLIRARWRICRDAREKENEFRDAACLSAQRQ